MMLREMEMTIPEEIEDAMRNGANPLFLCGLIALAECGDGNLLMEMIDEVGQRVYLEKVGRDA